MGVGPRRLSLGLGVLALAAGLTPAALAAPRPAASAEIRLEAGPLGASLFSLARQTGVQIIFTTPMVAGRRAPAVVG